MFALEKKYTVNIFKAHNQKGPEKTNIWTISILDTAFSPLFPKLSPFIWGLWLLIILLLLKAMFYPHTELKKTRLYFFCGKWGESITIKNTVENDLFFASEQNNPQLTSRQWLPLVENPIFSDWDKNSHM